MPHLQSWRKTTKGSLQNVSWTRFRRSRKPRVLFTTLLLESQTSLQTDNIPPIIVTPWRTRKSKRGPMYNLTSRASNLLQRLQYVVQQNIWRIAVLPLRSFQYLLQCLQQQMSVSSTNGTHFCLSMETVVPRTRRIVTFYVHYLPFS